jgi:hypothetical protein
MSVRRLLYCLALLYFCIPKVFSSEKHLELFYSGEITKFYDQDCMTTDAIGHRVYWHLYCDTANFRHAYNIGNMCIGCSQCLSPLQLRGIGLITDHTYVLSTDCRLLGLHWTEDFYCCYKCDGGILGDQSYGKDKNCLATTRGRSCASYQKYIATDIGKTIIQFKPDYDFVTKMVTWPSPDSWEQKPSDGADNTCENCPAGQHRGGTSGQTTFCNRCATGTFRYAADANDKSTTQPCKTNRACTSHTNAVLLQNSKDAGKCWGTSTEGCWRADLCGCERGYYVLANEVSTSDEYRLDTANSDEYRWYSTLPNGNSPFSGAACHACPVGKTTTAEGHQECVPISESGWGGLYYDASSNTAEPCPRGTYQNDLDGTRTYENIEVTFFEWGINVCILCEQGTAGYQDRSTMCSTCLEGTYTNVSGALECMEADKGYYVPSSGMNTQLICPAGTYQPEKRKAGCNATNRGYYQDLEGRLEPKACPDGTYSSEEGAHFCRDHSGCSWSNGNGIYDLLNKTLEDTNLELDDYGDYIEQYTNWLDLTAASISEDTNIPRTSTHDTICRCNPGFYFDGERVGSDLFSEPFANEIAYQDAMRNLSIPPRIPCWPVTPGFYTDTYNAVKQIPHRFCNHSESLKLDDGKASMRAQRTCQCRAGYYRTRGGTGIQYPSEDENAPTCTGVTVGEQYVPTDGCSGGDDCRFTAHTCTGTGLIVQTEATATADIICQCDEGFYRTEGGTNLPYNAQCEGVQVSRKKEFVDGYGFTEPKISQACNTYIGNDPAQGDGNGHVTDVGLTATANRQCKCAVGFHRTAGATGLESPYKLASATDWTYPDGFGACNRPGETNGIKNGFVDQTGQTDYTPYTACNSPSTINSADALSYYHDRKCQCQVGYYHSRPQGYSFSAGVNCTDSGVGFIVPVVGSSTRIACGTNTTVAAGNKPGYCPYSVNSVAILYPTCYDSQTRPSVTQLSSTRSKSSPGKCQCRQGYYRSLDGDSFDYFNLDGSLLDLLPECTAASQGHKVPNHGAKSQIECTDEDNYQPRTGQTTCISLPACHSSTVNDPLNTNTTHGRRCKCAIGYYDTVLNGGTNLLHIDTCKRPCFYTPHTCEEYLPPGKLGANKDDLVHTTPCDEGTNLVLQTDITYTSGYLCDCKSQHYRKLVFDALEFSDILAFQNSFSHLTYVMSCNTAESFDFKYYNNIRYLDLRCGDTSLNSGSVRLEIDMPVSFPVGWTGSFHAVGLSSSPATTQFQNDGTVNNGIELWSSPAGQNIYTLVDAKLSGVGLTGTRPFDYTITVNDALAIQTDFKVKFKSYSVGYSTNVRLQSLDVEPRPLVAGVDTCEPWTACPDGSITETDPTGTSQPTCKCDSTSSYNTLNGDIFESPGAELVFYLPFDSNFLDSGPEAKAPVYEQNVEISSGHAKVGSGALYSSSRTLDSYLNYQALPPINMMKEGMASCWWMQMFYDDPDVLYHPIIHFRDRQNHEVGSQIVFYYDSEGEGYDQVEWTNYIPNYDNYYSSTYGGFGARSNDTKNYHYCFNLYTSDAGFYAFQTFRNGNLVAIGEPRQVDHVDQYANRADTTKIPPLGIVSWDVAFFDFAHYSSPSPVEIVIDDFRVYRGQLSPENVFDLSRKKSIKHCRTKDSCEATKARELHPIDSISNRQCECAPGFYDEANGTNFEAPGNNNCQPKGECVTPSTKVYVEGGLLIDRTCQCESGYYHPGSYPPDLDVGNLLLYLRFEGDLNDVTSLLRPENFSPIPLIDPRSSPFTVTDGDELQGITLPPAPVGNRFVVFHLDRSVNIDNESPYIQFGSFESSVDGLSTSLWFRRPSWNSSVGGINLIQFTRVPTDDYSLQVLRLHTEGNVLYFHHKIGGINNNYMISVPFVDDEWYHIVLIYRQQAHEADLIVNGTVHTVGLNGIVDDAIGGLNKWDSVVMGQLVSPSSNKALSFLSDNFFVDDWRLYDSILSAGDIEWLSDPQEQHLTPGTYCFWQNTCNQTSSSTVQVATAISDAQCTCNTGYFRDAGDTFFITTCPDACQAQSCTEVGTCSSPSTIQFVDSTGTADIECQCAPGYFREEGGTGFASGTMCQEADYDNGQYVPDAGSSNFETMSPCPPSTEVDSKGSITAERTCRCKPGFYRLNIASSLPTSINCSAVDGGFTAFHSATEQEPHVDCPPSTIEFASPTSTSQRRCQCDRGYYKESGGTNLLVNETCTAATSGWFVAEIGSTSQEPLHECGPTLAVQSEGTSVSDIVCECAPQHYATQWENLAWDDSCTARSACEGSLTYMMVDGVFVEPPGDSESLCMCRDGFYLTDPFNLPPTATCFESGDCNSTLQLYQLGDIENPTLCECAPGYYFDLVMHHRKHALMELSFESGTSVQDSFLGHVFTLGSLIDLPSPTPASFTPGRVGQYSLDFSGNEIYYYSQNYDFYREGIDGLTLSFHVNLNSEKNMQLAMDLSAFRVILRPSPVLFFSIEYSAGALNVGALFGRTLDVNVWHHCAVVFNYQQHTIRGYVNGTYSGAIRDWDLNEAFLNSGTISIGGLYGYDTYNSLDGRLDDVRFFSDVLTDLEIGTLANYKQKDVFLDIPTDKSWFSGLPTTSECTLLNTCHSSAMSMWPDPANPTEFDTFGDTLCTCKPGFYRPVFASNFDSLTECIEAPSGYFVANKNQTSYEEWGECGVGAEELTAGTTTTRPTCQCVAGYYRPEGGYNFAVNLDCTAASHLYYVPEKGSSTQLVCPDGTNNIGTANTECGPCLLFDHFGYCWEPYTTILQTTDGVIRADEVTVSFDGLLRSGPQIQPFCDFIDYHGDFYKCLQFPNCPKQGTCNIETLNLSSDLSCDRITSQTRCSDVENTAQTYHPLFLVQTYDLHYCTANPSCSQFQIDPLLCTDCGSFCTTSYLKRKNFTEFSPDYDPMVLTYDEYMFEFTSLDCAELPNHAFLGVGSDFITPGNKFLHYWDVKWRGLSSGSFSTIAFAGSNETVDWIRASNPRILLHHFWGDRQVGLEVSIGSILVRLLHNRVQVLKQDVVDTLIWERSISHLDTKTLVNSGVSKVLFDTTDETDASFCSSLYQDGSCSATWTQLKSRSTFPVQFITSHIRPQDTSPTNTLKISFWDGELYDLPLNLSEFISLATRNSYRDDIQYPLPLKRYTEQNSLMSPVLDRRVLPPRSQDTSQYLCKESPLNNPSTTPVGAWLLQYYLMTDNIFTNFTMSYSDEIYRSLSGLVLDASNGLVTMSSNVYPGSIVALSQSLQCGDSEKSTLSELYRDLQDVYTATSVSINSRLMSEGSFYLNATLDKPDYYLQYRGMVNEQLNLLESTSQFLVSRVFSVGPKTNYSHPTGEFFIWRDVSLLYPAFDLGAGARPGTLGSKHYFRSFTPHFLSIEGSNIKQAFLYYRQAICSTGLRADCISDPTKWLTPEEQSQKGWEMWYHIFDDGSLDTLKIPLPLLPIDVYEVSIQVVSVKTFRSNQQLYRNVQRFLTGDLYSQTQQTSRYEHAKLWNRFSLQKDIVPASDFEVGVFDSNLDLHAHFLPSDSFVRFETGEASSNPGFTFCMTYYPLTAQEPIFRIQDRIMNVRSGLPVKLQDGTESVLGYYTGAWDVVAQRARGDPLQKLTCICYLSSGGVFLNGLSISDPSITSPIRVFLGDHVDIGTATYEPEFAMGPQGILLYLTDIWPSALDHDSIMKYQTEQLTKHSAAVVKSPLFDSFYAERHIRVSAIAETDASMPFYYRNFIDDVSFSNTDLALNSADFDPKLVTENCEANGYDCTFLYTRFDTSIPSLCVDGVDSSIYRPREMYGTCSSQDGILTKGELKFISNNQNTGLYRIYDGFHGVNRGLLLIVNLVVNINAELQPDFNSEIMFSDTMDFSLSRFDRETLALRACGQHVSFHIPANGAAFEVQVQVSINQDGDVLVFWWDGKPIESFYFTRKYENNSHFVGYEKCLLSSGQFRMFRTERRSNIGVSSFYAMSPYPTKSVAGVEMVDRHLQSFHISGPNCRKKCVVHNEDPNTVSVDGVAVADIGEKKIRLLSKTHKNWALVSDSFIGFIVRADPSFDTSNVSNVDFLEMEITLPFAHLVEEQGTTILETIFLTVSGSYEASPTLQVELRAGIPPFDQFRSREIYSERRTFLGVFNQRNLQVEIKMRGNRFMLYLDGEEKYSMFIGKRFPLSELVIVSRKPHKFEDGLYEYSDFIILTKAHENCECRSDCGVATFASGGECLACPGNTFTFTSGATSINECVCKPLHRKNESGLCEPILHSTSSDNTLGYCTPSSCALRQYMVEVQHGCSCTDDCFVETLQSSKLPCCPNKCVTCPPSVGSAEGEYFGRNCKCEYDASQGIAVNRAGTTGCSGFVCGPGFEPLDGHCSACVENFYKVGVNLKMCVACQPCPEGYFRDGCQNSSSGVCLPCSTCGTGETVLEQCGQFSDTLCFDSACDTTPPTSHLLGPFGLLVISSGASCIISPENRILECWGVSQYWDGFYQQDTRLPVPMHSNMQPVDVQMGDNFICLLSLSGFVQCAGSNADGQLGMGSDVISVKLTDLENNTPIDFGTGVFIVSMAVGSSHSCVLSDIGTVLCFGLNNRIQLGRPVESSIQTPVDVGSAQIVLQVSCGLDYSCVRLQSGGVKCFGNWQNPGSGSLNRQFSLGDNLPELDLGTTSFAVDVQASGSHTCVRFEDETVKCFGQSGGYLGFDVSTEASFGLSPETMGSNLPTLFGEQTPIRQMSLTPKSSCFLTTKQRVICVGSALFSGYYSGTPPHNNILTTGTQETWYLDFQGERILSIFAFEQGEKNCAYTFSSKVYCWSLLLPSIILELDLPTELCPQGDYSTQCRTNDVYQLLFSRGFLSRRSPLGRRTAEEYGILTSCRQCTTTVEDCSEGYYLDDACDFSQASYKDNSCLPCSSFRCTDPSKFLSDEDCGVLTKNSTRFSGSIECTGICSQQEDSYLERGCNVL